MPRAGEAIAADTRISKSSYLAWPDEARPTMASPGRMCELSTTSARFMTATARRVDGNRACQVADVSRFAAAAVNADSVAA